VVLFRDATSIASAPPHFARPTPRKYLQVYFVARMPLQVLAAAFDLQKLKALIQ
jgi:hypothetical protein